MLDLSTELKCLFKALPALLHQFIVAADMNAVCAEINNRAEDVCGPVKQGTGQHGGIHSFLAWIGLFLVGSTCAVERVPGGIDAMLGVVESAPSQRFDQILLGFKSLGRGLVVTNPVAVVENKPLAVHGFLRAVVGPCATGCPGRPATK